MENCKQAPGTFIPVINRNKCEGKGPCIEECPFNVLEMHILPEGERGELSLFGQFKGFMHGWKQAAVRYPYLCQACGKCVSVCPEKAITLARSTAISAGT